LQGHDAADADQLNKRPKNSNDLLLLSLEPAAESSDARANGISIFVFLISMRLAAVITICAMDARTLKPLAPPVWKQSDGSFVSCLEKIKVLNQNYAEIRQVAQDLLDDAVLMGCSAMQIRQALHKLVDELGNTYGKTDE
jgi:hypothetical protein